MVLTLRSLLFAFLFLFVSYDLPASHAMGADLSYRCLGGNQFEVNLSFYRDCIGVVPQLTYMVRIGSVSCGQNRNLFVGLVSSEEVSPLCPAQLSNSRCRGGTLPGVEQYLYRGTITLPANCSDWIFSFAVNFRNNAINTILNPGSTDIYVEAKLNQFVGICNSSPQFTQPPVPYLCQGQPFVYNHGAVDPDGDSLVYTMIDALQTPLAAVTYINPYSGQNPVISNPQASIDPLNGTITLTPTQQQIGVLAVKVDEYRNGQLIGSTIRDIQLTIIVCTNNPPSLSNPLSIQGGLSPSSRRIEMCPDSVLSFVIYGSDIDQNDSLTMIINNLPQGMSSNVVGTNPDTAYFTWAPPAGTNGLFTFFIKIEDNACPIKGSQTLGIEIQVLNGTTAGEDKIRCGAGSPTTLSAIGGTNFNWRALSGDTTGLSCTNCPSPQVSPSTTTTYIVDSNFPCNPNDTITVHVLAPVVAEAGNNIQVCDSTTVLLQGSATGGSAYQFQWSPANDLSNFDSASTMLTANRSGKYFLRVTSAAGCTDTDSVEVAVSAPFLSVNPQVSSNIYCGDDSVLAVANVTNGDCETYTLNNIPHSPLPAGTNQLLLGDDQISGAIPLGFDFDFFCNPYSSIYVCSNGWLSFTQPTTNPLTGTVLPSITLPNNIISFAWEDLNPFLGGNISYGTFGTAPNRVFTLDFDQVPHCCLSANPTVTVQVVLYESSNVIEIHNVSVNNNGGTWVQGIENATGTRAYVPAGRNMTIWSAIMESWRYTPLITQPYTVTWQSTTGGPILTGDSVKLAPNLNTTYRVIATDNASSCMDTAFVTIDVPSLSVPNVPCILLGDSACLSAVYTGPDLRSKCDTYGIKPITYDPEVITAGIPLSLADEQVSGAIPIGFEFDFYCNSFNQLYISSNGWLSFDITSLPAFVNNQISSTAAPNNLVAFAWDDLNPAAGGTIQYQTLGVIPNRRFVLEFTNVPRCCVGTNPKVNVQVVLHETSNAIEFHLINIQQASGANMVLGVENSTGQKGIGIPNRNDISFGAMMESWRMYPLGGELKYIWTPQTDISGENTPNPKVAPGTGSWYTVTVANGPCSLVDSVFVCLTPLSAQGWQSFEVKARENKAYLRWMADFESVSEYDVEISTDAVHFDLIATVPVRANAAYTWTHNNLKPGKYFYRIKAKDLQTEISTSSTREVRISEDGPSLFPNPSTDIVWVKNGEQFILRDMHGRLILNKNIPLQSQPTPILLKGLSPGVYLVKISGKKGVLQSKLIIE